LFRCALAAITATDGQSPSRVIAQTHADRPASSAKRTLPKQGYIFGLPIVMNYGSCTSTPLIETRAVQGTV